MSSAISRTSAPSACRPSTGYVSIELGIDGRSSSSGTVSVMSAKILARALPSGQFFPREREHESLAGGDPGPLERELRKGSLQRPAVMADLHHEPALRIQVAAGFGDDAPRVLEPVAAARQRHRGLLAVFVRQLLHRR